MNLKIRTKSSVTGFMIFKSVLKSCVIGFIIHKLYIKSSVILSYGFTNKFDFIMEFGWIFLLKIQILKSEGKPPDLLNTNPNFFLNMYILLAFINITWISKSIKIYKPITPHVSKLNLTFKVSLLFKVNKGLLSSFDQRTLSDFQTNKQKTLSASKSRTRHSKYEETSDF